MELLTGTMLEAVIKVVNEKAKFQKVMLIYDENVSTLTIDEILSSIKEICIFNKKGIEELDENELFNGYKLVIYFCSSDSLLKLTFNRGEFVNLYISTDSGILPFFINSDNYILTEQCYLYVEQTSFDFGVFPSIYFNQFYNNLKLTKNGECSKIFNDYNVLFGKQEVVKLLTEQCLDIEFLDVKILKATGLGYDCLSLVDLILINGFLLFLSNIKNNDFEFVDLYKSIKDDAGKIDKFFALSFDKNFLNLIYLNYNFLFNMCLKAKEKIIEYGNLCFPEVENYDYVFEKLKQYSKDSSDLVAYFYLFNYFGV